MGKTGDEIDDITAKRISSEIKGIAQQARELSGPLQGIAENCGAIREQISIRLRDTVYERGLLIPVSELLGSTTVRLMQAGLGRDAVSQVLFSTWNGRKQIVELEVIDDVEVAAQVRRIVHWCLREISSLVKDRDDTPAVAWMLMQTVVDVFAEIGVASRL